MTMLKLLSECGEFCTARTHPSIVKLRQTVLKVLENGETLTVDRSGLKSFTVSFLDEWLGTLIAEKGVACIRAQVQFQPPLEPFLEEQLERSFRLRHQ